MHIHFTYQHMVRNAQLDKAIQSHVRKLEKLLVRFSPDLIHLHGLLEFNSAHNIPHCSLNLSLPTAQLHAREEAGTTLTALQACFDHLIDQVKKHKRALRKEELWRRRQVKPLPVEAPPEVEETPSGA